MVLALQKQKLELLNLTEQVGLAERRLKDTTEVTGKVEEDRKKMVNTPCLDGTKRRNMPPSALESYVILYSATMVQIDADLQSK